VFFFEVFVGVTKGCVLDVLSEVGGHGYLLNRWGLR
jgi:hypothetical protein